MKSKAKGTCIFPLVKKQDYSNQSINTIVDNYFQRVI